MNCKPGDLAVVVGGSAYAGMLVEVLYEAPASDFFLPDGHLHYGCEPGCWVLKVLGSRVPAPIGATTRLTRYGVGTDRKLRPIRPGDLAASTDNDVKNEVTA